MYRYDPSRSQTICDAVHWAESGVSILLADSCTRKLEAYATFRPPMSESHDAF